MSMCGKANRRVYGLLRRFLCLLEALALTLSLLPLAGAAQADVVRVGFFAFDGYHMVNEYGERSGYGYDYLQNLAQHSDFVFEYVGYDKNWKDMQEMLENGEIDLLTSAQKTQERLERFDFSEQPIGTSETILTVKAGDTRYMDDNYAGLDGMRVGMLEGNSRNASFQKFAVEQGFSYEAVYFASNDALLAALQNGGGIDGVVTSNLRKIKNEWIVASFDPSPFYVMVRKGDRALLDRVNRAIEQLAIYKPNLQTELYHQYYSAASGDDVAYTAEERAYLEKKIDGGEPVQILLNPDRTPFSHWADGEIQGIFADVLQEVMEKTGLSYEIVPLATRAAYEDAMAQGTVQICFDSRYDFNKAEQDGYKLTEPYLEAHVSCLTRKDSKKLQTVAAVRQSDITEAYVSRHVDAQNLRYYDSVQECVDAVLAGRADAVYLYTYTVQQYLYQDDRNRLQETLIPDYTVRFSIAVGRQENPLLFSILNKTVLSMGDEEISSIVRRQTAYEVKPFTVLGYLYSHPWADAGLVLFLLLVAVGVASLIFQRKSNQLERERNQEFARFILYVCRANDKVLEYDFAGGKGSFYQIEGAKISTVPWEVPENLEDYFRRKVHPDDWEKVKKRIGLDEVLRLVEAAGELYFECRTQLPTGEYAWFSYAIQGMAGMQKEPGRVMVFIKNIQQAKQEEESRRQAMEDALSAALQAGRAKSEFLSRMSHEIRTPLNAILGYLKIMETALEDPAQIKTSLEKQEYAARHLLAIINDILDVASIESGKMKLAHEAFDVCELLAGTSAIFEAQAQAKGIAYRMQTQGLAQCEVIGDRLRVNQILINLLSNAVKFTQRGGVTLTVAQKGVIDRRLHLQMEIRDTGIGMSEEYMTRIFTPFEQQEAGTAERFGGTGLGLSITKNLVMMMNGTIDVQSKEGEGSCFTVGLSFEMPEAENSPAPPPAAEHGAPLLSGKRVLLAEDNEMNREIATCFLEAAGLQVVSAVNGKEAVEAFCQSAPAYYQFILMDIQMPYLDGYEAARKIRGCGHPQAQSIPIIACSADAFAEDVSKALAAGMNGHVSKPINFEELCHILEGYFEK